MSTAAKKKAAADITAINSLLEEAIGKEDFQTAELLKQRSLTLLAQLTPALVLGSVSTICRQNCFCAIQDVCDR